MGIYGKKRKRRREALEFIGKVKDKAEIDEFQKAITKKKE
jgi:hypothetical protein